jgi:hypothetical protein
VPSIELVTRVERLEDDPPIGMDSVDLSVNHPGSLRRMFGEVFTYIAAVERAVTRNVAEVTALLPELDATEHRFLRIWSKHELAHATIFDALRVELDLTDIATGATSSSPTGVESQLVRPSFRTFGRLATNRWLHDVFKLVYLSRGAMHEHMTYDCYRRLGAQLDALGERALVETVTGPIRRQEAAHLGYYRLSAVAHRARLTPAQIRMARQITLHTYLPVGAGLCGKQSAGRVFTRLAGDDMGAVLDGVEGVADELLGNGQRSIPGFVHAAMDRCLRDSSGQRSVAPPGPGR